MNFGTPQTCMFFQEEKSGSGSAFFVVFCFFPYLKLSRDVPSSPVVKTELPVQWVQVRSLIKELRSNIPNSMAENK